MATTQSSNNSTILVIDDSETIFQSIQCLFISENVQIQRMEMFVQLPSLLRTTPPDLILLDINIPGLSGERIGGMIRKYELSPIPIIIYSSCSKEKRRAVADTVGAVTELEKNCPPEILKLVVLNTLNKNLNARVM